MTRITLTIGSVAVAVCAAAAERPAKVVADYSTPKATFATLWQAAVRRDRAALAACFCTSNRARLAAWDAARPTLDEKQRAALHAADIRETLLSLARAEKPPRIGAEKVGGDREGTLEVTLAVPDAAGHWVPQKEAIEFVQEGEGDWKVRVHVRCLAALVGDFSSPKAAFETLLAAARRGDRESFLSCFDADARATFAELDKHAKERAAHQQDLAGVSLDKAIAEVKAADVKYGEQTIDADAATLQITMKGRGDTVKFAKEKGRWKISVPELKMAVQMMRRLPEPPGPMIDEPGEARIIDFRDHGQDEDDRNNFDR